MLQGLGLSGFGVVGFEFLGFAVSFYLDPNSFCVGKLENLYGLGSLRPSSDWS